MPREQVQWFVKQSLRDNDRTAARQSCLYSSVINVNKTHDLYGRSFEREQTWTMTRTMAKSSKIYQSSIENIHLNVPSSIKSTGNKRSLYTSEGGARIRIDRLTPLLPSLRRPNGELQKQPWKPKVANDMSP